MYTQNNDKFEKSQKSLYSSHLNQDLGFNFNYYFLYVDYYFPNRNEMRSLLKIHDSIKEIKVSL